MRETIARIATSGETSWMDYLPAYYATGTIVEAVDGVLASLSSAGKVGPVYKQEQNGTLKRSDEFTLKSFDDLMATYGMSLVVVKGSGSVSADSRTDKTYTGVSGAVKIMITQASMSVVATTISKPLHDSIDAWFVENSTKEEAKGTVFYLVSSPNGLKFERLGQAGEALQRNNYTPEVLANYDRLVRELTCNKPKGRLAIFDGPPGTGKTYVIKALLNDCSNSTVMVIVPPALVPTLVGPDGVTCLMRFRAQNPEVPLTLILEDADDVLVNRERGNIAAISGVLNLGDGIVGATLDIRIVATTNAKTTDLDPAIKRPGRLNVHAQIGKIPAEQCEEIYKRLTGNELKFDGPSVLAEVYQKAYDAGWLGTKEQEVRRMGFA